MSAILPSTDPVKLAALLATGAEAQEASMKYIGALEATNQKQASDIAALRLQVSTLQAQVQTQQKQAGAGLAITPEQADKYAGILVSQNEISPADKKAAAQRLIDEPHRVHGVIDKIASLLPAPALPRNGAILPRGGHSKFAGDSSAPKKEIWFAGQSTQ